MTAPLSSSSAARTAAAFAILVIIMSAASPLATSLGVSSTVAVSHGPASPTVCGITAGQPTQSIQCYADGKTISVQPNVSFSSVSGGRGFFCGLCSGGLILLCWDTTTFQPKRIYYNHTHSLTDLTVGDSQICAIPAYSGVPFCWRFPSPVAAGKLRTITAGGGFSCGILYGSSRVVCWGGTEVADDIQAQFGNLTMSSLVAGESHACGVTRTGIVVCKGASDGGQLDVPIHLPFEFSSNLALGANHSCGILRKNGSVICWGGGSKSLEFDSQFVVTQSSSFEAIVSGLDFVCGLTTKNLSLVCWGPGWFGSGNVVPLGMVIPGPCVQTSCSICGVYPNSDGLCGGYGSICKSCEVELPIPALIPPMPSQEATRAPSSRARKKLFWAFGVVGSIGAFAGICTISYCLWSGFLRERIHKSVQPSIARVGMDTVPEIDYNDSNTFLPGSSSDSRKLRRQRSGTSSKHTERAEKFYLSELAAATNNFSMENKIGWGSFGTVYKATLVNGREVAIKRGYTGSKTTKFQEKESAFDSEVALLSRVHHKHLVELVGYCEEEDERLLVYEYMSNGSLHSHLHSKANIEKDSSILNSWQKRIKIALDAARGIEYLHNYAVPPIIHRDIKSSNILLDSNWTAKVSDFGLSLIGPESDQGSMSTKAVGTVGYIDPEYYVLDILTAKSDIYGLGVVLLELLTGKRAVFKEEGKGPIDVVEYARPRLSAGELRSILDMRVGLPDMNEAEAVELVAYTALRCVNLEGKERPSVADIVANLERAMALFDDSHCSISSTTFSIASE
ncbi:hypothetical protein RJ639_032882 [Escallonia herrerae]|uniref:non-specific serine/threonine protein kinase n=1 Tax=Escallonia herrerae TaxID=1293975 RepID=A0AA88WWF5_9ASTE|nr:hypothetical protein RJ639_032882 [Escallonia herrerae]